MAKVKIVKTPGAPAHVKSDGTRNFFTDMLQYPNIVSNSPTAGIINTEQLGTNDQQISGTLKPVPASIANIEAEKDEMILKPGGGFYKVGGKTHAQGGTPLSVPHGSFVFSNSPDLAFNPKEKKLIDSPVKSDKEKDNTPARLAAKEVDPKKFNTLMAILNDPDKDVIAKSTAALMLDKMQSKLGEIALLQEIKKNLPDGIPSIASVPSPANEDDISAVADSQYMKKGGKVMRDPGPVYFFGGGTRPPDLTGKWAGDNRKTKNPKTGQLSKDWNAMTDFQSPEEYAAAVGFTGNPKDIVAMQRFVMQKYPEFVSQYHSDPSQGGYGLPNAGRPDDGKLGVRWNAIGKAIRDTPVPSNMPRLPFDPQPITSDGLRQPGATIDGNNLPKGPGQPVPGQLPWKGIHFQPNGAELLSIALPGLEALATPTYYDMLSQKYTPDIQLDRVDNAQERNDIKEMTNLGTREAYANMAPGAASAVGAQARSRGLGAIHQSDAQTANTNIQIDNQEKQLNFGAKQNDDIFNINNVHQTYNNNVLAKQRRNESLINGLNQTVNNGLAVKRNLDTLGYMATAAALPSLSTMKDENGEPVLVTGSDGKKYSVTGVPFGFDAERNVVFDPRFGSLDSFLVNQYSNKGYNNQLTDAATSRLQRALQTGDSKELYAASRAYNEIFSGTQKGNSSAQNAMQQMLQRFTQ